MHFTSVLDSHLTHSLIQCYFSYMYIAMCRDIPVHVAAAKHPCYGQPGDFYNVHAKLSQHGYRTLHVKDFISLFTIKGISIHRLLAGGFKPTSS